MIAQLVPVLLAFGANLDGATGSRGETILAAQRELATAPGIGAFRASPLRESVALTPDGPDPLAPRYLNGVALAETTLGPHELLDLLQAAEDRHGRVRANRASTRPWPISTASGSRSSQGASTKSRSWARGWGTVRRSSLTTLPP